MHDDCMPNHAEYTVLQKAEGRILRFRIALIVLYVLLGFTYTAVVIAVKLVQIIALLPILIWIVVHFTWRYFSLEHSLTISEGTLTVTDILKDGKKIRRLQIVLADAESLSEIPDKLPAHVRLYDFRGNRRADNAYCIYFKKNGEASALYLRATPDFLRILKRFIRHS